MIFKSKRPEHVIPDVSIYEFIFEGEKSFPPDKPCVIYADDHSKVITFGELKNLVLRFGASLERFPDFERGDTIAVYSPNDVSRYHAFMLPFLRTTLSRYFFFISYLTPKAQQRY